VAVVGAERCSARSTRLDEAMLGTASTGRAWLLIEDPGPWGRNALRDSRLAPGVGERLERLSRERGIRVLLIRRPGRSDADGHHVLAAHTGPGTPWIERGHVDDVRRIFDLDLDALAGGRRLGLEHSVGDPVFLVCTHGRRDVCCAEKGRPLAAELSTGFTEETWESSHVGGDRFAGNLVCFPHGLYFGRVAPEDAWWIADQYAQRIIDLDHYRGRTCYPFAVQAGEAFLRRARGLAGVDELRLVSQRRPNPAETEASFSGPTGVRYFVRVRSGLDPRPRRLTCSSEREERPPAFELLSISAGQIS
jgi:hypothetical protein